MCHQLNNLNLLNTDFEVDIKKQLNYKNYFSNVVNLKIIENVGRIKGNDTLTSY